MTTSPLTANHRRMLWTAAFITGAGALLYVWMSWCAFPGVTWNEIRLAPAFAWRHGWSLYPPIGGGPLSTWIYGPIGAFVNLPATFATSAVQALQIAGVVNFLTLVAPVAAIYFSSAELKQKGPAIQTLALGLGILALPFLGLVYQVPDHTATALGLMACWILARPESPGPVHTLLAAFFCVAAIWTKQTGLFLVPALAVFLLTRNARAACGRFLLGVTIFSALTGAFALMAFGADGLWLNLLKIPGQLPWGDFDAKMSPRLLLLLQWVALPWVLLALVWWSGSPPPGTTASGRMLRCTVLAAAMELPVGLAGVFKIGGEVHLVHSAAYLFPALVLVWLARGNLTPVRILVVTGVALALHAEEFTSLPTTPYTQRLAFGERLAHANPGHLWFPQNPLVTFFSDGKLYHVEDGILTRNLAGLPLRQSDFHRHLPENLVAVVYPIGTLDTFSLQLIPEFNFKTTNGPWELHQIRGPR